MSARPYRELVGCLSWLALVSRPDIAYVATTLARFGNNLLFPDSLRVPGLAQYALRRIADSVLDLLVPGKLV